MNTPDRRNNTQLIHINLLKLYKSLDLASDSDEIPFCTFDITFPDDLTTPVTGTDSTQNFPILSHLKDYLSHLSPYQAKDITTILSHYPDVLGDHPLLCNLATHDVELLLRTSPLRHPPYRLHPQKRDLMRRGVDYSL